MKPLGTMLLRFFGGMCVMPLASVLGAFVFGFAINMIWHGLSEDKNVGLGTALEGIFVANVLAVAGLAWFSIRRRDGMPVWGGLTAAAAEYALLYNASFGPVAVLSEFLWPILLAIVVGAFALGVTISLMFRQLPTKT
jgi:hypothetical protein